MKTRSPFRRRSAAPESARELSAALPGPRRLPALLRRAWHGLNQAFRHRAASSGITPDQYIVLRILNQSGGSCLTQGALVEAMSSDPNTVASLVRRMERQGLVKRRPHPRDGRARCLSLLPAGRRKFARLRRVAHGLQAEVLSVLAAEERAPFLSQLDKLAQACWERADSPRPGPGSGG